MNDEMLTWLKVEVLLGKFLSDLMWKFQKIICTNFLIVAMKYIPVEISTAGMADGKLFDKYIGNEKGIQGHQNSCYLDATLFGLFALSSCFDELFLHDDTNNNQSIENIIWKKIVNPLRR